MNTNDKIKEQDFNDKYEEWLLRQKMEIRRLDALARQRELDAKINKTTNRLFIIEVLFIVAITLCVAFLLKTLWL